LTASRCSEFGQRSPRGPFNSLNNYDFFSPVKTLRITRLQAVAAYQPVAEVKCAGKMGTASHFRIDIGRCFDELRLRKWLQSPVFPT
jgi:hypothetical protein